MADENLATAEMLSKLFDVTPRAVRKMAENGIIPKADRNRYPLIGAVRGYIKHLREESSAARRKDEDDRFRKARADVHEITAAERRGDVAPKELLGNEILEVFVAFVRELETLEPRLASLMPDRLAAKADIHGEITRIRERLAGGLAKHCRNLEQRARRREAAARKGS